MDISNSFTNTKAFPSKEEGNQFTTSDNGVDSFIRRLEEERNQLTKISQQRVQENAHNLARKNIQYLMTPNTESSFKQARPDQQEAIDHLRNYNIYLNIKVEELEKCLVDRSNYNTALINENSMLKEMIQQLTNDNITILAQMDQKVKEVNLKAQEINQKIQELNTQKINATKKKKKEKEDSDDEWSLYPVRSSSSESESI